MCFETRPPLPPATRGEVLLFTALFAAIGYLACSGSSPQARIENPTELCANAVALSSAVKTQAAKLGLEPIELARRTCDAAILAIQVAEANLRPSGTAGAGATSGTSSLAGMAGTGG